MLVWRGNSEIHFLVIMEKKTSQLDCQFSLCLDARRCEMRQFSVIRCKWEWPVLRLVSLCHICVDKLNWYSVFGLVECGKTFAAFKGIKNSKCQIILRPREIRTGLLFRTEQVYMNLLFIATAKIPQNKIDKTPCRQELKKKMLEVCAL